MNQNLREQATQLLDMANNTKERNARPTPCPACGMMMALPESSTQRVTDAGR
ncbi:hypothetical protein CYFUS_001911 [Cystobacter fuscus]|uniref:Uncharacterized protein n=1 Tax=Cystobacter fuscus TaxID=43 RepID=A0A250IZZ2_9BACT|nr:hypothetical protein [Cystobacter fuscus]ATB36496.1 hypothetical protein CYFUS_001911 [Cystobacter fuscus]